MVATCVICGKEFVKVRRAITCSSSCSKLNNNKRDRIYRKKNHAKILERERKYNKANHEAILNKHRRYYQKNKDRLRIRDNIYRSSNKDKEQARRKKYFLKATTGKKLLENMLISTVGMKESVLYKIGVNNEAINNFPLKLT